MHGRSPPPRYRILRPSEESVLSSILPNITHRDARLIQHREVGDEQFEHLYKRIPPSPDSLSLEDHVVKEWRAYVHVREAARVHTHTDT